MAGQALERSTLSLIREAADSATVPDTDAIAEAVLAEMDAEQLRVHAAMGVKTNELRKAVKLHPLGEWIGGQIGVGEKQAGRLLGVLGNPAVRMDPESDEATERTVSQLWSYCGYGDAKLQVRRRGEKANWNATLKMRAFLIAESCIKQKASPYRVVYDEARAKYADAVHADECKRCGPSGKPAQPGSPLSDGHKHARALRLVAKAFLRDLWEEARRVQRDYDSQVSLDPARELEGSTS